MSVVFAYAPIQPTIGQVVVLPITLILLGFRKESARLHKELMEELEPGTYWKIKSPGHGRS